MGCGFACRQWSSYGLARKERASWLSPSEAAKALLDAAAGKGARVLRLTAGEPFLYPEHVIAVAARIVDHLPQDGLPLPHLVIETNGLLAGPQVLQRLETIAAADRMVEVDDELLGALSGNPQRLQVAPRIEVRFSVKAFEPELWSWHTGRPPEQYEALMGNVQWALGHLDALALSVSAFDCYAADEQQVQAFLAQLNRWRAGAADYFEWETLARYFRHERPIDARMGQRRLAMARRSEFWGQPGWDAEGLVGNDIAPPYPQRKES